MGHEELGPPVLPWLDGKPSGGSGPSTLIFDPATGNPLARIHYGGPEDIERAAESAARSSALWRGSPFRERGQRLRKLAALIHGQAQSIAELISREQGKPYLASGGEIFVIAHVLDDGGLSPEYCVAQNVQFLNVFDEGQAYRESQYRDWLTNAGFVEITRKPESQGRSLITARKA